MNTLCLTILMNSVLALAQEQVVFNCTTVLSCQEQSRNISLTTLTTAIRGLQGEKGERGDSCDCPYGTTTAAPYTFQTTNGTYYTYNTTNIPNATEYTTDAGEAVDSCDCQSIRDNIAELKAELADLKSQAQRNTLVRGGKVARGQTGETEKLEAAEKKIGELYGMMEGLRNRMRRMENQFRSVQASNLPAMIASNARLVVNDTLMYLPTKCSEIKRPRLRRNATIYPLKNLQNITPFFVDCSDGGWIVIQRRLSAAVDFNRIYREYQDGFGDKDGDFWIGLDTIRMLVSQTPHRLRITMKTKAKPTETMYAEYGYFYIGDEGSGYELVVSDFHGNATDYLTYYLARRFSARDVDRDATSGNCASANGGGWWYYTCGSALLNAEFVGKISWGDSLVYSEMKVQPTVLCGYQ